MCTSILFSPKDHYFGRNLDLEVSFGQKVVITPRRYKFNFRKMPSLNQHYALIGIAAVVDDYPLYFDAANEKGLGMAGLNYPDNAYYPAYKEGKDNVSPFEFIPWILGQCQTVAQAKKLLGRINLVKINFNEQYKLSPLHWLLADKTGASLVVEADRDGLHTYDDALGVLTNNPSFPHQVMNLNNYASVSPQMPVNQFAKAIKMNGYSRGLGSRNLPGGMDAESRFVRVAFNKFNAPQGQDEQENVINYFHILHSVEQQKGLDQVGPDQFEFTIYSDGTNLEKGLFYYTTYTDPQIHVVHLHHADLTKDKLITYPMQVESNFTQQN